MDESHYYIRRRLTGVMMKLTDEVLMFPEVQHDQGAIGLGSH